MIFWRVHEMKKLFSVLCAVIAAVMLTVNVSALVYFPDFSKKGYFGEELCYKERFWEGYPDGTFRPNQLVTRAEYICHLFKLDEETISLSSSESPTFRTEPVRKYTGFSDVKKGSWYYDAVVWAYENGIVNGSGNGKFDPGSTISVLEYALIQYRYCELRFGPEYTEFCLSRGENDDWDSPAAGYLTDFYKDPVETLLKKAILVDIPEWFSRETSLESVLKHPVWLGGDRDLLDMTKFVPTRGNLYMHTVFRHIHNYPVS